jgi:hypothetical protein
MVCKRLRSIRAVAALSNRISTLQEAVAIMKKSMQIKLGPELLSASGESWLGYYVFAGLSLAILGGGALWLRNSGLEGGDRALATIGIGLGFLVSISTCMICHFMGHIFDWIEESENSGPGEGN